MSDSHPDVSNEVRRIRGFVALLAVLLVLVGQFLSFSFPIQDSVVFPPYTWISIAGVILFLWSLILKPSLRFQALFNRIPRGRSLAGVCGAVVLTLFATFSLALFQGNTRLNYISIISLWLMSAFCYVTAFSDRVPAWENVKDWLNRHRNEILTILLVTVIGAVLRFYLLGSIPRVIDGDEGRLGMFAQTTTGGDLSNPFALWENFGALYLQVVNVIIRLLGPTALAVRLLPAISGTLAVPALYLFSRQIVGHRTALIAAVLLAISHTHINFSRIGSVAYIHGTWLVPLELYFLFTGLQKRSSWRAALGGVILALHFSVYLTAQIVVALVLAYMLIAFFLLRSWFKPALRQAAIFWGGFLIVVLPEAFYAWSHPNDFFNRLGENGTFQTGWLAQTMASTGQSAFQILGERVVHAFLSLIYYPTIDFYGSPVPMLTLISAAMFLLGLGISLWRMRSPGYLLLNGYFWALTLAVGIFAIPPSADSYRMLMVLPAALLMAAIGIDQALELFGMGWKTSRTAYIYAIGAVLLSLFVSNMWTYWGDFAGQCRYGVDQVGRFASYLGGYVNTLPRDPKVYLLSDDIYFYGSHASVDYLDQVRPIINFPAPVDTLNISSGDIVIAPPVRVTELETWIQTHPGGKTYYQYDCQSKILGFLPITIGTIWTQANIKPCSVSKGTIGGTGGWNLSRGRCLNITPTPLLTCGSSMRVVEPGGQWRITWEIMAGLSGLIYPGSRLGTVL